MKTHEICTEVTNRIIAELEKGKVPWERPWVGAKCAYSRITGKRYSLLNQLLLPEGEYATFKTISKEGGRVNKGAKAYTIVFWDRFVKTYEEDGEQKTKVIPLLKYFKVFNIEQQTNLELKHKPEEAKGADSVETLEDIKNGYISWSGVGYEERESNEAFYSPTNDNVVVPLREQFEETEGYYGTVFHELAHSTGAATRLNRDINNSIFLDRESYSREELVAELTSSSILANMGMETAYSFKNNTAYIQSWIRALKNDTKMIVWASSRAEKAFDMIVNLKAEAGEATS